MVRRDEEKSEGLEYLGYLRTTTNSRRLLPFPVVRPANLVCWQKRGTLLVKAPPLCPGMAKSRVVIHAMIQGRVGGCVKLRPADIDDAAGLLTWLATLGSNKK